MLRAAERFRFDEEDPAVWGRSWPWMRRRLLTAAADVITNIIGSHPQS